MPRANWSVRPPSKPYIVGWGETGELDAIRGYTDTINTTARRIEGAVANTAAASNRPVIPDIGAMLGSTTP
jgi:hypothetical protein